MELKPTSNRKTKAYESQKNTFGLLPGKDHWNNEIRGTCPGATTGEGGCWNIPKGRKCAACYVTGTMSAYPGVYPALKYNTKVLCNPLLGSGAIRAILNEELKRFENNEMKRKVAGKPYSMNYRLHWSGDVFDENYAGALSWAISDHPNIHFWCYTRSMFAVPYFANLDNINLYISLDPQNFDEGMTAYVENKANIPYLRLCYMSPVNDFAERLAKYAIKFAGQNAILEMIGAKPRSAKLLDIRMTECPADSGKMKNITGCCSRCRMCIGDVEKHIWFKS